MLSKEAKRDFTKLLGPRFFLTGEEDRILYGSDATNRDGLRPDAVARPESAAEVSGLIKLARQYGLPVVPRGAGSGLSGGALPVAGGIVVAMTRFNRILGIDPENRLAVVEPGVVTSDLQAAVEKAGLFYPPDPASRDFSTLGGNAAENAGGSRAVKYGVTRDYITGLQAVLGTGEIIETGADASGYDMTSLLVGSEGTLAIITRLTLRLIPMPEAKETVVAYYPDLEAACRSVSALTSARIVPITLEFMDRASLNCVADYTGLEFDPRTRALLLIETAGPAAQARAESEAVIGICIESGAFSARRAETASEVDTMWKARRAVSPALFRVATGKFNEDVVVPRTKIPEMIGRLEGIAQKHGLEIISFGHAGDGNIHVNVMFDKFNSHEQAEADLAVRDILADVLELGGTMSGEHGVGTTKKDYINLELPPEALALMRRIKTVCDPDGLMNPGKIFPS